MNAAATTHARPVGRLPRLGDPEQARAADRRALALALTGNPAEQAMLRNRIGWG